MSVKALHSSDHPLHFVTFTCFQWINLFELTNGYEFVYNWFEYLKNKKQIGVVSYVIMPNHVHLILYVPDFATDLNKVIGNGKRFLALQLFKYLSAMENMIFWICFMTVLHLANEIRGSDIVYLNTHLTPNQFIPIIFYARNSIIFTIILFEASGCSRMTMSCIHTAVLRFTKLVSHSSLHLYIMRISERLSNTAGSRGGDPAET